MPAPRCEADIRGLRGAQATQQQAGNNQQHGGQCELPDHERVAQRPAPARDFCQRGIAAQISRQMR